MFSMAANETVPSVTTSQISTTDLTPTPATPETPATDSPSPNQSQPPQDPGAAATQPAAAPTTARNADGTSGVDGEEIVWEARYAMKNFIGRITLRTLLTVAWIALAIYTWGYDEGAPLELLTIISGGVLLVVWIALIYRIILARFGHYYRLTTRRLFVSTGLMRRRRDQLEILRVKDVFTRQTLTERWLKLGTVIVVPDDRDLPTFYLSGVDDPKGVHDLVWHVARSERDRKSVKVQKL